MQSGLKSVKKGPVTVHGSCGVNAIRQEVPQTIKWSVQFEPPDVRTSDQSPAPGQVPAVNLQKDCGAGEKVHNKFTDTGTGKNEVHVGGQQMRAKF